ncbi:ATP-binding protein [Archangium lansingense]|uniref:histidine kinase n=1 Tax=Archangium lansingense TaxID=2995310 RepID=A0ABT4A5F1_9BACT|nr:ATP-binding protein [Archangium lansinium]MCY1076874.1 PAS domain-containing protein [Archangium lansinium]
MTTGGESFVEDQLRASNALLRALTQAQADFIRGSEARGILDRLLTVVLELTGSTSGVIGELLTSNGAPPSLRLLASLPREEADTTWELPVRQDAPEQAPSDLRTLVGAVVSTGAPVLSGVPGAEHTFLGLPLESEGERVGLVGLAQRPGGYDTGLLDFLQPFLDACGGLLAGGRNERRRRLAEQEMRQTQEASAERVRLLAERLRLVLESMQDGLWDLDMTTGQLFANRAWLGMLGYAEGELEQSQTTWARLCHPDDVANGERLVQEHLKGAIPLVENEQRLRRKDGGWSWVLTRARVVARDEQGRPLRMVGTNVDITVQKRNEERLRSLIRTLPDLVLRQRADGTYLDYHAAKPEDLAVPPERIIGSNMRQTPFPASLIDKMFMHLGRAIREGTLEVFDYALELPNGREYFEARIRRSGPDEAVSIIRNITERKLFEQRLLQQEEELRRHRDSLEELVRNRSEKLLKATIELEEQQAQLIQTEKLASLGQMAAGVAHEINNPVSYVMSNLGTLDQYVSSLIPLLQLLRELVANPGSASAELLERLGELWKQEDVDYLLTDMPELVEESLVGARRVKEIAQSLRTFAREDTGEPQLVDVNTELASTLKLVWNELKYKCEVKRDFGPLPPVSCHPTQIGQVFSNLLINASHAIETRGEIRIRTRQEGSEVVVEIADTGKGMSQETLSKLFTPFFTTKPRGQGTGLGLSVSYGIIAKHKGRIDVQSQPGQGSTFTIRLPAAQR